MTAETYDDLAQYVGKTGEFTDDLINYGYNKGRADAIKEFAEWLPKNFDLRFSNNPHVWVDEFLNHTSEKIINEYKERSRKNE